MLLGELWRRAWYRLNRTRFERELQDEMAAHREALGDVRGFGNTLRLREEARDAWGWGWLDRLGEDVRAAIRLVRSAPGFALAAALILGAGIGLTLTCFHLFNVTTRRPPAVSDPASLLRFTRQSPHSFTTGFPLPAATVIEEHNDVLDTVLTRHRSDVWWDQSPSDPIKASFVSANWFAEMGYQAERGRVFGEAVDSAADAPLVVVLGHHFHRVNLQSDPNVIGRQLRFNERLVTVIGVAPQDFPDFDLDNTQLWLLIDQVDRLTPGSSLTKDWSSKEIELYGRLKPTISPDMATEGLKPAVLELTKQQPKEFKAEDRLVGTTAEEGFRSTRERRQMAITVALAGSLALLVLLVTSANLANFVLSHAITRLREFSIRTALGATRSRILRQILAECAMLVTGGALIGILLAWMLARLTAVRAEIPPYFDFTPDLSLFAAATVVAVIAMLPVGLVPAWMIGRRDLSDVMRDGGQQASAGLAKARFRLGLVGTQVVGCCALLIVAGAIYAGLRDRLHTDPGFRVDRAVVLDPTLSRHGITGEQARSYWTAVSDQLSAHPQIEHLALAVPSPIGGGVTTSGYPEPADLTAAVFQISPAFFRAMEIPLLAGRVFGVQDGASSVIVSRGLALRVYGSIDVIGKRYPTERSDRQIVGVVGDATLLPPRIQTDGTEYVPMKPRAFGAAVLVAKSHGDPAGIADALRSVARNADARVLPRTVMLAPAYESRFRLPRLARLVSSLVAVLVLALACFGIAGIVAYAVKVRTKELGIRRALGANGPRLCGVVLRQLLVPVVLGGVLGVVAGLEASRVLARDPFNLAIGDAGVSAVALSLFVLSALTAALAAASRALSIDPIRALRHD